MKRTAILITFLSLTINLLSQDNGLQFKFDSIIKEANTLYYFEKAAWNSSDLLRSSEKANVSIGGYVAYNINDTVIITYASENQIMRIANYRFLNSNLDEPFAINYEAVKLNDIENQLFDIRKKILSQLLNGAYEVLIYENYSPNFVLIKDQSEFRFYIIMGANKAGVVPFGNDYLFKADKDGNIIEFRKFHSKMIPVYSEYDNGGKVTSATHSHLKTTPYITATDICTFRLYAQYTDLVEFKVYSTALGKTMKYNLNTNTIELVDL